MRPVPTASCFYNPIMKAQFRLRSDSEDARIVDAAGPVIRLGRDADNEVLFTSELYPKVSGLHARIEPVIGGFQLVHLSTTNKTLLNGSVVAVARILNLGDVIRLGSTGPLLEILHLEGSPEDSPTESEHRSLVVDANVTVQTDDDKLKMLRGTGMFEQFKLGHGGIFGRDRGQAQYHLKHPLVSRRHAELTVEPHAVTLRDLGTPNGTFVNGERIGPTPRTLTIGDRIDIGPFSLHFDGQGFSNTSRSNNIELVARGLTRVVPDAKTGLDKTILDDLSLVIKPKEFVCLLGPTGSGKTTLLRALSGRVPPTAGEVLVNGVNLTRNFHSLKHDIAVVPQRDALHESLLVEDALRYTAELRLPTDTDRGEVQESVNDILGVVEMVKHKTTRIRELSGGQIKRTSLANEILSKPSLLFLDEVTSGLDEQTDRKMMELFRLIADGGKTVVCITHNLTNLEEHCHLVVILAEGGKLAFVGSPKEARDYFQIDRLGVVYEKLKEQTPTHWQEEFRRHRLFARYVTARLPETGEVAPAPPPKAISIVKESVAYLRQWHVLTRRMVAIWNGDRPALGALLGQSLLVAALLVLVFGTLPSDTPNSKVPTLLFLLAVSSFWLGCNTAAKELVKERIIFERERAFNLRPASYFAAKFLVLGVVGLVQVLMLFLIVKLWCEPGGVWYWQLLTLTLLMLAGTSLGLLISVVSSTEEMATALVPIVVIPQIIMGGGVVTLEGFPLTLAKLGITCHWGYDALLTLYKNLFIEAKTILWPLATIVAQGGIAALITLWRLHCKARTQ